MALSANVVWEIRTTGSANNGGGFVTGATGVDYSQQNSAQFNLTGVTNASSSATVSSASAATTMVGNIAQVISGTNFTTGFYEIISVVAGVSITFDRVVTSAAGAAGVINIGGAFTFNNTLAADYTMSTMVKAGHKVYIKSGTYSTHFGAGFAAGTATNPVYMIGYNVTRGDEPTGSNRPTIPVLTASNFPLGAYYTIRNVILTGNVASNFLALALGNNVINCKIVNATTTAANSAVFMNTYCTALNSEFVCYRGIAVSATNTTTVQGCYIHDSDVGIYVNAVNHTGLFAINNIIANCVTAAISLPSATVYRNLIMNNTLYGAENQKGIGVSAVAGVSAISIVGNIIYGFATGVSHGDAVHNGSDYSNTFYNNAVDVTNWTKSASTTALNPSFTNMAQVTGTTATTASSILTDAAANFTNVVVNQDYCYLVSGTGVVAGVYAITAKTGTSITLSPAPGNNATADKVYRVTTGGDFSVGTNMKAVGVPLAFGATTVGYMDLGAVQRKEKVNTSPGIANVRSGTGWTYDDASLTGTAVIPIAADVRLGTSVDASTGTLDLPNVAFVVSGTVFDNTTKTGTYALTTTLIADAVWNRATSGHTTAGTFGLLMQKLLKLTTYLGLK